MVHLGAGIYTPQHFGSYCSQVVRPFANKRVGAVPRTEERDWRQVDLRNRVITIEKAKSVAGKGRVIPMNTDLWGTLSMHATWYAQDLERYSATASFFRSPTG